MTLRLSHVSKSFGGIIALADVSLEIAGAETLGIIGPNGSGKSTIFNLISGLIRPDAGTVTFDSYDLCRLRPHELARRGVARVFQQPQLCAELNAFENIAMGVYALRHAPSAGEVRRHVASLGLDGLAGKLDAYPGSLSQFEIRAAEMARATLSRPRLLLLDEPTAGFTRHEREVFAEIIGSVSARGVPIIIIEHDLSLIQAVSGRVIVLDAGQKVVEGSPGEVARDPTVAEIYIGSDSAAAQ